MAIAIRQPPSARSRASTLTTQELSELLRLVYQGPLETPPWRSVLEPLRVRLGASFVFFILRPPSSAERGTQIVASEGELPKENPEFYEYGYSMDPFVNLPRDKVVTVDEMIGAKAWVEGAFYRRFLPPGDQLRYILGADIRTEEGVECRLRVARPATSTDFSEADKALCQLLLPHFACSVRFHARLNSIESERTLFETAVDRMLVGTLIYDDQGALMKTNAAADAMLAEKDGLELVRGMLHASYVPEENRALQRLIATAASSVSHTKPSVLEAVSITRPSGKQKLGVLVRAIPIGEWSESQRRPAVAVFVRDPDRRAKASHELAHRLFNLTPAESSLCTLLANGLSLDAAAEELGIRKNTARAHLRSIFSKVGVSSQSALVRVLLNSVMYLE